MRILIITGLALFTAFGGNAQGCCSGGGGSPMAGGAATGVLQEGQMELVSSYKYSRSNRFLSGDQDTVVFFDNLTSNYLFLKADYGISDRLTLSIATGYYLNRTITEFADTTFVGSEMEIEQKRVNSSGIGDLIIFPRYNVYEKTKGLNKTELSLGMGLKIPIGAHNDSNFVGYSKFVNFDNNPPTLDSTEIWQTSPPTVQATTGSHDLMFYGFYFKSFPKKKLRLFASALYVKKGWNSLGLKFGDYASLGLFAGTTVFKKIGLVGQIKGEWVGKMQALDKIDILSEYSIDQQSTGSQMVSFVPQVMYTFNRPKMTVFATADIPLYQNMRGTQVASQYQVTGGVSYRFFVKKKKSTHELEEFPVMEEPPVIADNGEGGQETTFRVWGKCGMCKTTIENTLKGMKGITFAEWNLESQSLKMRYDEKIVSLDDAKATLANVGYDTKTNKASDKAYDSLHSCCKYERP